MKLKLPSAPLSNFDKNFNHLFNPLQIADPADTDKIGTPLSKRNIRKFGCHRRIDQINRKIFFLEKRSDPTRIGDDTISIPYQRIP